MSWDSRCKCLCVCVRDEGELHHGALLQSEQMYVHNPKWQKQCYICSGVPTLLKSAKTIK